MKNKIHLKGTQKRVYYFYTREIYSLVFEIEGYLSYPRPCSISNPGGPMKRIRV